MTKRKHAVSVRSRSQTSDHARAAAADGFSAFTVCRCGNERVWVYDTDSMTGSSYAKCGVCWRIHPFKGAWLDNALGMNFGSWWSQRLAPGFII